MYMTGLTQLRTVMAKSPHFAVVYSSDTRNASVLPKLSSQGNLLAGATMRVAVGFMLNPISVLKARYEVWPPCHTAFCWYLNIHRVTCTRIQVSQALFSPLLASVHLSFFAGFSHLPYEMPHMREYSSCYTRESSASPVNTFLALLVLLSNLTDPPVSVFRPTSDAQSTLMHTMSA